MPECRWLFSAVLLLGGCASSPPAVVAPAPAAPPAPPPPVAVAKPPHYRCEGGLEFDVRFGDGSAELLFAAREPETLLRDAGGTTPQQTVYSNTSAKVEFDGRDARLNLVAPPLQARCVRD
ncbi:hypothetical protein [Ramlibacter sp. PS4R-6]|uniref:hypothetical protein n=1 Tax=Ramlibacter sp. PS4R-6 TaxID=3133438 RepID=UPI0030B7627E